MGRYIFPKDKNPGDYVDIGFNRFTLDVYGRWKRTMISIEEIKNEAKAAAEAESAAKVLLAEAEKKAAETARAAAEAAKLAAETAAAEAATEAAAAATTAATDAITTLVGQAPDTLDTIAEIAAAVQTLVANAPADLDTLAEIADAITKTDTSVIDASTGTSVLTPNTLYRIQGTKDIQITLDADSHPVGTEFAFVLEQSFGAYFMANGTVAISSGNKLRIKEQYATAAILKVDANTWVVSGSLAVV